MDAGLGKESMEIKNMGVWMMSMNIRWKLVVMLSVFTAVFCALMLVDEKMNSNRRKYR